MKKYMDFAFPRMAVGLFVGIMLFAYTFTLFHYRYDRTMESGFYEINGKYENLLDKYEAGEVGPEFIEMITHFYRSDYLRMAQVDDSGNFKTIYETEYGTIAAENGIHDWVYITDDDSLAGSSVSYNENTVNGFELNIKYLKCDEIKEVADSMDILYANSYDMMSFSEGWYSNGSDTFYMTGEILGMLYYPQCTATTFYIEDDYLHLGQVTEYYSEKPFGKKSWDFTDPENKDKYTVSDDVTWPLTISIGAIRPDYVLGQEKELFGADSLDELYKSNFHEGASGYSCSYDVGDGNRSLGYVELYQTGGNTYVIMQIITVEPFARHFMPFLVFWAFFLLFVCIGLPMLMAVRPYRHYKKAYENSRFKNNLIDALAHNLKTPLMVLGGYAENLKDVDGDDKNRYADQILAKTAEMNAGIEAILKTAEKNNPVLVKTSVREIIEQVCKAVGADAEIEGDAVFKVDKEYFAQAMTCLIDNASRYKTVRPVVVKISPAAIVVTNKTDKDTFTPGTGLAIAGRILEQHKLRLTTAIKGGVFEARVARK